MTLQLLVILLCALQPSPREELEAALAQSLPRQGMVEAVFLLDGKYPMHVAFDFASGAWYRADHARVEGRTPDGRFFGGESGLGNTKFAQDAMPHSAHLVSAYIPQAWGWIMLHSPDVITDVQRTPEGFRADVTIPGPFNSSISDLHVDYDTTGRVRRVVRDSFPAEYAADLTYDNRFGSRVVLPVEIPGVEIGLASARWNEQVAEDSFAVQRLESISAQLKYEAAVGAIASLSEAGDSASPLPGTGSGPAGRTSGVSRPFLATGVTLIALGVAAWVWRRRHAG